MAILIFFSASNPRNYLGIFCSDGVFKFDELVLEILSIALPAALALGADPLASLVDTAFVGHIGKSFLGVKVLMIIASLLISVLACFHIFIVELIIKYGAFKWAHAFFLR